MHQIDYVIRKEEKFFVSQCLNVDVSSFGETRDEAVANLKEAMELYFHDEENAPYSEIELIETGKAEVYA